MRRRDFLTALGGTALLAKANAPQPRPVIGFLHQWALPPPSLKAAFRKGLVEVGISDGLDIRIEDGAANGEYDQLPALAADLVNRQVAVIAAELLPAALAAKAATQSIPIVFLSGSDPIKSGLVSSINRPTSNVTGIAVMFTRLGAKNLELLRELVPQATVIAALANPINPNAEPQLNDLQVAARALGLQLVTLGASNDAELDSVFPTLSQQQIGALIVTADGYLISRQDRLVNLANRFAVPAIYPLRQYAEAGGLISYGREASRRVSPMRKLCRENPKRRQAHRSTYFAAGNLRTRYQSQDRETARHHGITQSAGAR
jgi:putative tryptophan/tyrosine transport system substrate-binding protein